MGLGHGDGEPTTLVGREEDVARLRALLASARVLTLTGPGGVGKTRLSRRVMAEVAASYEHGAHFVPLAGLRDPQLLATTVAQALGRTDAAGATTVDALVDYLAGRHLLLVLDNCEHLVDEVAALVHTVASGTPRVQFLATSRQSLAVAGEQLRREHAAAER